MDSDTGKEETATTHSFSTVISHPFALDTDKITNPADPLDHSDASDCSASNHTGDLNSEDESFTLRAVELRTAARSAALQDLTASVLAVDCKYEGNRSDANITKAELAYEVVMVQKNLKGEDTCLMDEVSSCIQPKEAAVPTSISRSLHILGLCPPLLHLTRLLVGPCCRVGGAQQAPLQGCRRV